MKATATYHDTCLSDYFLGTSDPITLCTQVDGDTTAREVLAGLREDLDANEWRIPGPDGQHLFAMGDAGYDAVHDALSSMFHAVPDIDGPWDSGLPVDDDDSGLGIYVYVSVSFD